MFLVSPKDMDTSQGLLEDQKIITTFSNLSLLNDGPTILNIGCGSYEFLAATEKYFGSLQTRPKVDRNSKAKSSKLGPE